MRSLGVKCKYLYLSPLEGSKVDVCSDRVSVRLLSHIRIDGLVEKRIQFIVHCIVATWNRWTHEMVAFVDTFTHLISRNAPQIYPFRPVDVTMELD